MGTSSSCRPPSGDVAVAEEQRGDRSGLERLSPKPHGLHVLTQERKSLGQGEMVGVGLQVRDSLGPCSVGAMTREE